MTQFTIENTAEFANKATKSVIKGALIDGITTVQFLLCLPFINDHKKLKSTTVITAVVMETLTSKMFYYTTSVYTAFASVSYYIRAEARENGAAEVGGIVGGAIKYGPREMVMNYIDSKPFTKNMIFKAELGAKNNLLYELCNNNPEGCAEDTIKSTAFAVGVEAAEAFLNELQTGSENLLFSTGIGAFSGLLGGLSANYIYVPLIPYMNQAGDLVGNTTSLALSYVGGLSTHAEL